MKWLELWEPVGDEMTVESQSFREAWERELRKEVTSSHVLYGFEAKLIARRYDSDDALYKLDDGRVARVHLTWKQAEEIGPRWPRLRSTHRWNVGLSQDSAATMPNEMASGMPSKMNEYSEVPATTQILFEPITSIRFAPIPLKNNS
jgi:hypothetical protein